MQLNATERELLLLQARHAGLELSVQAILIMLTAVTVKDPLRAADKAGMLRDIQNALVKAIEDQAAAVTPPTGGEELMKAGTAEKIAVVKRTFSQSIDFGQAVANAALAAADPASGASN